MPNRCGIPIQRSGGRPDHFRRHPSREMEGSFRQQPVRTWSARPWPEAVPQQPAPRGQPNHACPSTPSPVNRVSPGCRPALSQHRDGREPVHPGATPGVAALSVGSCTHCERQRGPLWLPLMQCKQSNEVWTSTSRELPQELLRSTGGMTGAATPA